MSKPSEPSQGPIPSIVPERDEVASRQQQARAKPPRPPTPDGGNLWLLLLALLALAVAAVASVWAWQLRGEMRAAQPLLSQYERRIGDLEARLSDTDEGVSLSVAATADKIKELYSEVDKLWASAWRANKARLDAIEQNLGEQQASMVAADANLAAQLKALAAGVKQLQAASSELQQLLATSRANQGLMERLGDDVSKTTLDIAKLAQRVQAGEDWQGSVDGFRRQVNQGLLQLREQVSELRDAAGLTDQPALEPEPEDAAP